LKTAFRDISLPRSTVFRLTTMRLLLAAALAALAAADRGTTVTGPADPFSITGGAPQTFGALPSATQVTGGHPGRFSTASQASVQTTISIWSFGPVFPDTPTLVASIISANPTATVMYLTCLPASDVDEFNGCGLGPGLTVTQLGSTAMIDVLTDSDAFSWSESCTFPVSPSAVCVQSAAGTDANFNGVLTTTLMPSESVWIAVDVTAGAELLAQATGKPTATGKGGSTAANGSASSTGTSNAAGRGWVGLSAAGVAAGALAAGMVLL
jgi:hypothetical protein